MHASLSGRDATASSVPQITVDSRFKKLCPPLRSTERALLETAIRQDGCREPLSVWKHDGKNILLDGHNRYALCSKYDIKFNTVSIELADRDHAELWILENQIGKRNLTEDQQTHFAGLIYERRAEISRQEQTKAAGKASQKAQQVSNVTSDSDVTLSKSKKPKPKDTVVEVAKQFKVPKNKLKALVTLKKKAPELSPLIGAGDLTISDAKKIAVLDLAARKKVLAAVNFGTDVRTAVRESKKEKYTETIATLKPKVLEGPYRIVYADPAWKYYGLNQADEHGHAERHYNCLTDEQLCDYKVAGKTRVRDITDKNAVLFLWVTSPLLERCFQVIKAWGFEYKANFVWDKVKHNMGHYNSVRHEFLLICTKGSCTPDIKKLVDSVQSIERSGRHSEKPVAFYDIIEGMYDHGRKLELFGRSTRDGWDVDGNEV